MPGRRLTPSAVAALLLLAVSPAFADDSLPAAFTDHRDFGEETEETPTATSGLPKDMQVTVMPVLSGSVDFWGRSRLSSSTRFKEAFAKGYGGGVAGAYYLDTGLGRGVFDDFRFGTRYGYAHREFRGRSTQDDVSGELRPDTLKTDQFYTSVIVGYGTWTPDECNYGHVYLTGFVGADRFTETRADVSLPSAAREILIRNSWGLYGGGGLGGILNIDRFGFQIEGGARTFGLPKYGPAAAGHTNDWLNTTYVEFSISLGF